MFFQKKSSKINPNKMQDITAEELKSLIKSNTKINLIDVREQYEYDEYNMNGTLIPLGDLQSKIDDLEELKNEEIIVHCKSGMRSAAAKAFLEKNGFTKVRNLIGGAMAYRSIDN